MAEERETLLKRLTGLLKRITDSDDDYTVTADQRAALMELESLTWNYPSPGQGRGALHHQDQDDEDDDDEEDAYYVDIAPYDMTERLKEVNRALIEDPTPAECDRAITIRFRDVIAEYQSPRELYPSDSDDGYGDSSDILYDAEEDEEDGLTSLTAEVRDSLTNNVNVIDLMSEFTQNSFDILGVKGNNKDTFDNGVVKGNNNKGGDVTKPLYANISSTDDRTSGGKVANDKSVPKLNLGNSDETNISYSKSGSTAYQLPSEKSLLQVDDSGLADLEMFMKENGCRDESLVPSTDLNNGGSVSLLEVSNRMHIDKGFSSLGDGVNEDFEAEEVDEVLEPEASHLFEKRESKSNTEEQKSKVEVDFGCYEYEDDFEQDDPLSPKQVEEEEEEVREEAKPIRAPTPEQRASPRTTNERQTKREEPNRTEGKEKAKNNKTDQENQKKEQKSTGHKSRKEGSRKGSGGGSAERGRKRRESQSPSEGPESTAPGRRLKRSSHGPPSIKPALLTSQKLDSIRTLDGSKAKSSSPTSSFSSSRTASRSLFPAAFSNSSSSASSTSSSTSSSPPSSAGNSSSSTSSSSSFRGRTRTNIGPVRPTQHRVVGKLEGTIKADNAAEVGRPSGGSRGVSSSPVRVPPNSTHPGLSLTPLQPGTRVGQGVVQGGQGAGMAGVRSSPPHRVRKAASASDLHRAAAGSEDGHDRKRQNDSVFKAWLNQKNKQAATIKKQTHRETSANGRSSAEVAERRRRAEEAFQAWLSRKREQLRLEKKMRGERRRMEDQSRYARTKQECEVAYKEWCRRKRDEVRTSVRAGGVPRSQSLERPWVQEKTRKLYSAYLNGN